MKLKSTDIIILLFITVFLTIIYIGFYFPDNSIISGSIKLKLLLYSIRILFPFIILLFIIMFIKFKKGTISRGNFYLSVTSILITLILIFCLDFIMFSFKDKQSGKFHPFLQLTPNKIDLSELQNKKLLRIACLGGSTTEFKDKKNKDWPEYLEETLNSKYGLKKVKVFNCGKQWYSTLHILINYQTNIRPYKPDIIIVMEAINDLLHNAVRSPFSGGEFRNDYGHFYGPTTRMVKDTGLVEDYFKQKKILKLWYQKPVEILEIYSFPGIASYKHNIQTIIDLAHIDGTKVVLMTQPTIIKEQLSEKEKRILTMVNVETAGDNTRWSYASAWRGMEQYNNMMRIIAKEQKVFIVDIEKAIPKSDRFFWDDVHYQDEAYPLITATIADALVNKNVIGKRDDK